MALQRGEKISKKFIFVDCESNWAAIMKMKRTNTNLTGYPSLSIHSDGTMQPERGSMYVPSSSPFDSKSLTINSPNSTNMNPTRTPKFSFALALVCGLALVFASCSQSSGPSNTGYLPPTIAAPAGGHVTGQPAYIQHAMDVQNRHTTELMAIPGVIGCGTGLAQEGNGAAILVFTQHPGVANIPAALEGIPTRIEMVGTVHSYGYTGTYRSPCPAGVSVGDNDQCAAGSIGAFVTTSRLTSSGSYSGTYEASGSSKDKINVYSNQYSWSGTPKYMLSCNHVFANENNATGPDQMDQPGRYDVSCGSSGAIGKLHAWNYIDHNHNNYYDAALAECNPGLSGGWNPEMSQDAWYTPSNPSTIPAPTVGTKVTKVGRTTGHTQGTIAGINVTIRVSYTNYTATFIDQIYVASGSFIQAGDSGSMMCTDGSSSGDGSGVYKPIGLNFAGSTSSSFANRMDYIAHDFGLSFVTSSF